MTDFTQKYCTLYLVRHGQTDWNAKGLTQGRTDVPLNSEGIKQAQVLGKDLKDINFDTVFSSDLVRAKKTAEIITAERKLTIETTHFLQERCYGKLEGKPGKLMQKYYDTWTSLSKEERKKYRPYENYETDEEVISRFITFLRETAILYTGKTVLIVCHGSVLRTLLNHLTEKTYLTGSILNSGYIKLESDGVDFFIKETKGIKNPVNNLGGRKVLIFGLGLNEGGVGSARFFASSGAQVKVTDLKKAEILKPSLDKLKSFPTITYTLREHKNKDIDWADLIIKNPAVKQNNPYIEYAVKKGKTIETDMGIFLQHVDPDQIIGVTGTKGKSTTASLIYEVLKAAGKKVVLAGNIGKSVLDTIPYINRDTLIVLELSSFQLESFKTHKISPKWAVVTNITPDHLNYYASMDEYINAKKIIGLYQSSTNFLFINKDNPTSNNPKFLKSFKGRIIFYSAMDLPKNFRPTLKGEHNRSNIAAALAVGKTFNLNSNLLLKSLTDFKGIPFRIELIKEWNGIKIYNDTAATSPEAGIQALKTFPGCILICGGMNKKMDYTKYATIVSKTVKKVFFLQGDSTEEIIKHINQNLIAGTYNDLERLLTDVKEITKPGDIILFSPAATSFNLFQNEFDRGRKFNELVEKIFK